MSTTDRNKGRPTVLGLSARAWGVISVVLFCFVPALLVFAFMAVPGRAWRAVFPWLIGLTLAGLAMSLPIASYLSAAAGGRRAIEMARLVAEYLPCRRSVRFRLVPRRPSLLRISPGHWAAFAFIMLIPALLGPGLVIVPGPRFFYYGLIIQTPDGYRVIDGEEWSEDDATPEAGAVSCWHGDADDSFIYPYRRGREVRVRLWLYSGPANAELADEVAPQLVALWHLPMEPRLDAWYAVRGGLQSTRLAAEFRVPDGPPRILWIGVIANLLITACAIAFAYFLMWWLAMVNDRRKLRRRWKALEGGTCPVCGYDIRYAPEHRCPECGEMWMPEEPRMLSEMSADRT
jgi:hypothetical protein